MEFLLKQMAVIVEKHTDTDLLEQAAMTYRALCDNDYTMSAKAQIERQTVIDSWVENFNLALEIFKEAVSQMVLVLFFVVNLSFLSSLLCYIYIDSYSLSMTR